MKKILVYLGFTLIIFFGLVVFSALALDYSDDFDTLNSLMWETLYLILILLAILQLQLIISFLIGLLTTPNGLVLGQARARWQALENYVGNNQFVF
ncbi:MAG: hypothetical protein V1919_05085 [Candidatus Omnitrophota bacterium]